MDRKSLGLESLNEYMESIMGLLIENENILRLLTYNDEKMYSKSRPSPESPHSLLYEKIFPFAYIPDIKNEVGTYITIEFDGFMPTKGDYFMYSSVVFKVFTHEDLQKTNYGNRLLLLYSEIHKTINRNHLAIGRTKLNRGGIIPTLQKPYSGHYFIYQVVDFN